MNHVYQLVWSDIRGQYVVAPEKTRSQGRKGRAAAAGVVGGLLAGLLGSMSAYAIDANTLPTAGTVTAGAASLARSGSTLNVNQTTQRAAINWQSFSVGANATVNFNQPNASAVTLNRVVGNESSVIAGALNANGQVFVLNSNGVLFARGAQVNVGGIVASTLNISDADFMAGKSTFTANGSRASVINEGAITTADGGYAALLGNLVKNNGVIVARLGTAALAAGDKISLNFNGNSLVGIAIEQGTLNALVDNGSAIRADGGLVVLTAKGVDAVLGSLVNNTGEVRAQTVANKDGKIYLLGDMEHGTVNVAGTLDASAPNGGNGGFVETSAATVSVAAGARVTTDAPAGTGGSWLIDPTDFTIGAGSAPLASGIGGSIGVDTLRDNLRTTDVTIAVGDWSGYGNRILFDSSLVTNADLGATRTLTLRTQGKIEFSAGVGIDATQGGNTRGLNVVLWTLNGGGADGSIRLSDTSFIKTNNGMLWMGGGNGDANSPVTAVWNGLTVGNGRAYVSSDLWRTPASSIVLGDSTIDTGTGDIRMNAGAYMSWRGTSGITSTANGLIKTAGSAYFDLEGDGLVIDLLGRLVIGGTLTVSAPPYEGPASINLSNATNHLATAPVVLGNPSPSTITYQPYDPSVDAPSPPSSGGGNTPTPPGGNQEAIERVVSSTRNAVARLPDVSSIAPVARLSTATAARTPGTVVNPAPVLDDGFDASTPLTILSAPNGKEPSAGVTLNEAREMLASADESAGTGGDREVRVPVSRNTLAQIVNGGVKLPSGVDQLLFVVKSN